MDSLNKHNISIYKLVNENSDYIICNEDNKQIVTINFQTYIKIKQIQYTSTKKLHNSMLCSALKHIEAKPTIIDKIYYRSCKDLNLIIKILINCVSAISFDIVNNEVIPKYNIIDVENEEKKYIIDPSSIGTIVVSSTNPHIFKIAF